MKKRQLFADRTSHMRVSAIREILKVATQPGMVSLAGGIPAPQSLPLTLLPTLVETAMARYHSDILQYGTTEGFGPLREALVDFLVCRGIHSLASEILITSGSQGVLNALGMVLISKGDVIAVEEPTYLGALQAFSAYEPRYAILATDEDGVIPEAVEDVLARYPVKIIYLGPTFQNPTGRTLPLHRRVAVARIIQNHDVLLIEDDPYSALRYAGDPIPALKTLAPEHVVYAGTLSKVFAPGLRIGFCLAPPSLHQWMVIAKQGIDLHTSTLNQALAAEYISGGHLERHLPNIIELYRPRLAAMLDALDRHFPKNYRWSHPDGGLFLWVQGESDADMTKIYNQAIDRKVAFVPGTHFFAEPNNGLETMRLNFSMADEGALCDAIAVVGELLHIAKF